MAFRIRKGDLVQVISGSDRGKRGKVLSVDRAAGRVRVEKVRMQKRHLKPGRKGARTGGVIEKEGYLDLSNVMLIDPADDRPARVRVEIQDGRRVRVLARSGQPVPEPARS